MPVTVKGVPEAIAELERVAGPEVARAALEATALYIKGKLATYPPARHAPQPFVSDRQRRGFFAKLKAGQIDVPYRRGQSGGSQRLGQSWTVDVQDRGAVIGNDATYGPLVQQRATQTAYHKATGWPTVEDVAEQEEGAVADIMALYIRGER